MALSTTVQTLPHRIRKLALNSKIREAFDVGIRNKIVWLKTTLAVALMAGIALSPRLWISSRFYPLTPVFKGLPSIPFPFDYLLAAALVGLLWAALLSARPRKYIVGVVVVLGVLGCLDQSRWQPWCYQYFLMFAALGFYSWQRERGEQPEMALNTCRLIVASSYFWSGVQKLNWNFIYAVFPNLISPYLRRLPPKFGFFALVLSGLVPLVEISVGLGLLSRRYRNLSVTLALIGHLVIFLLFVPTRRNTVIWPWNLAMLSFVLILFWREAGTSSGEILLGRRHAFHLAILILCGLMPAFSFFGLWDSYLSSTLYSGNISQGSLSLSDEVRGRLPPQIQSVVQPDTPGNFLSIHRWSYFELNVPPYPEARIYHIVLLAVCAYAQDQDDVVLKLSFRRRLFEPEPPMELSNCADLAPAK